MEHLPNYDAWKLASPAVRDADLMPKCEECRGSGVCPDCDGKATPNDLDDDWCSCDGTGRCHDCDGRGWLDD